MKLLLSICMSLCLLSGCGLSNIKMPTLYKVAVQQGNVITQEMVDKLKPGMSRRQVAFVMGEPVLRDPFDDSKWVYLYSVNVPGVFTEESRLILAFDENNQLTTISGDFAPGGSGDDTDDNADSATNG